MIPTPLAQIGLRWRDHKSALWWLALLYRRPSQFDSALKPLPLAARVVAAFWLNLHAFLYIFLLCAVCRLIFWGLLGIPTRETFATTVDAILFHTFATTIGIASGIAVGIAGGVASEFAIGMSFGISSGIAIGITYGSAVTPANGIVIGTAYGIAGGISGGGALRIIGGVTERISNAIALGIAGSIAGAIAGWGAFGIGGGIAFGVASGGGYGLIGGITSLLTGALENGTRIRISVILAAGMGGGILGGVIGGIALGIYFGIGFGVACTMAVLVFGSRIYYYPIHLLFLWPSVRGDWYSYHPVAWDDMCAVPFSGLDWLLVAYAEYSPVGAWQEIARIISSYPSQRMAALRAQVVLLARQTHAVNDLIQVENILAQLPEGEKGFLSETRRLREMVKEITNLQTRLDTMDRPIFREPLAQVLCKEIENFQQRVGGFHEPLASEFRVAATFWHKIAELQFQEAKAIVAKEPSPQVFRAGDPVDRNKEAFVPRASVVGDLEKQIMLSTGCPGIILYGRRRMGKSTIMRNLSGFLPSAVVPVVISMQNPHAFISIEAFVGHLATNIQHELRNKPDSCNGIIDLRDLFSFLSSCNTQLEKDGRRLLLALDEYENIDVKIGERIFPKDLLSTMRESIQSHRHITWIFAGSREITELKHAAWTSYLVSVRTIDVPAFSLRETRLLLTEPLKYSSLWPKDAPERPRFAPEFWSNGGIERIHKEAGGWPHLVQLIAETVVDLINEEDSSMVNAALLERALDIAIVRGHNVFYELMRRESSLAGEWDYLSRFRHYTTQSLPNDEAIYLSLRRRVLVEEENGEFRLRVPLMARWLRQRG